MEGAEGMDVAGEGWAVEQGVVVVTRLDREWVSLFALAKCLPWASGLNFMPILFLIA